MSDFLLYLYTGLCAAAITVFLVLIAVSVAHIRRINKEIRKSHKAWKGME